MKLFKLVSACLAVSAAAFVLPAQAQSVPGQGTWETTLLGRDSNFNAVAATDASAVYLYDTTWDVTWLRNANAGAGSSYDDGDSSTDGGMTWASATTWAANLVTGSGANTVSDWRLPTMIDTGNPWCNYYSGGGNGCGFNPPVGPNSEMAILFLLTLGNMSCYNTSGSPQAGSCLTNAGSFQNMQSGAYWLGTESFEPNSGYAWAFDTGYSFQGALPTNYQFYAMAVRPGDVHVASVPEPGTGLMAAVALAGIGLVRRRRAVGALAL